MGKRFGAKWVLAACVIVDSVSCILIPLAADNFQSSGVMVCRFFQGLAQGGVAPLLHMLLGNWAPPSERSVMATLSYSGKWDFMALFSSKTSIVGMVVGNVLSLSLAGIICSSPLGWPAAFYIFGGLGLKWVFLWSFFGANRPSCHKSISECERKYIECSLGQEVHKVSTLQDTI